MTTVEELTKNLVEQGTRMRKKRARHEIAAAARLLAERMETIRVAEEEINRIFNRLRKEINYDFPLDVKDAIRDNLLCDEEVIGDLLLKVYVVYNEEAPE